MLYVAEVENPATGEILSSYADTPARARMHLAQSIVDAYDPEEAARMQDQEVTERKLSTTESARIAAILTQE